MLERSHIQSSGFANVGPVGQRTGFRVRMRQPNYRGGRISLIEGIDISVDGETFPASGNAIEIDGRQVSHAELDAQTTLHWPVGTTIDVIVDKPGGLAPGVHLVGTVIYFRHPYFPPVFQPVPMPDQKHVTIIL